MCVAGPGTFCITSNQRIDLTPQLHRYLLYSVSLNRLASSSCGASFPRIVCYLCIFLVRWSIKIISKILIRFIYWFFFLLFSFCFRQAVIMWLKVPLKSLCNPDRLQVYNDIRALASQNLGLQVCITMLWCGTPPISFILLNV